MTKAYRASGVGGAGVTEDTPLLAAQAFFLKYPKKRKCSVYEGESSGNFFTVTFGRSSAGEWPKSWKDVTPKTLDQLKGV